MSTSSNNRVGVELRVASTKDRSSRSRGFNPSVIEGDLGALLEALRDHDINLRLQREMGLQDPSAAKT